MIDSYIQYGQSSEKTFYQVQNTKEQIELEDNDQQIASVYIRLDSQYDIYERRIYSVGELLGQMGGLFQVILMIGVSFVSIFSERLYVSSIIRKIYQIYQIDKTRESVINSLSKVNKDKSQINSFSAIDVKENVDIDIIKPKPSNKDSVLSQIK